MCRVQSSSSSLSISLSWAARRVLLVPAVYVAGEQERHAPVAKLEDERCVISPLCFVETPAKDGILIGWVAIDVEILDYDIVRSVRWCAAIVNSLTISRAVVVFERPVNFAIFFRFDFLTECPP